MSGLLLTAHDPLALHHTAFLGIDMQNDFCGYGERVVGKDSSLCGRLAVLVNEVVETALGAAAPVIGLRAGREPMSVPENMRLRFGEHGVASHTPPAHEVALATMRFLFRDALPLAGLTRIQRTRPATSR